ncbi:MAG: glycosyltransferase family 1 protein [Sphingomonadaceae bacterium]|uniref:glycosyltransferase family 4 protein n=1 Tax=Thermaurantiacus sp. TaxID=2820283 RepID=UPI00298F224D|nr:glycosyltransferase family 1 protein [Thermaurantiacus sp.]MCS6987446.1 glycosyltransferase family 1 protein [Sphingomonadaceae bacterium]MDW8415366.1 glycosyltransferase family 1 protein [Thermaurantiacus sp.]
MRLALVTDAWTPQVNGVVRTLATTVAYLEAQGWEVLVVSPDRFRSLPCPTYPEIRLALASPGAVGRLIRDFNADALHIATEGPLGLAARRHALRLGRPFTTSFHTRFPDYLAARFRLPPALTWSWLARFHRPARAVLVATPTLARELARHGILHTRPWSRGVDTRLFRPGWPAPVAYRGLERPILLSVGRVAVEKNLEAFLTLNVPGTKVVVGDGPALADLRARFPQALFLGALHGEELARAYAGADLFVFPSRTDTFGLVLLEAMASGLPVAAFPVPGPLDVVADSGAGVLDADLGRAVQQALKIPRAAAVLRAREFSWERSVEQFAEAVRAAALGGPTQRAAPVPHPHPLAA